MSSKQATLLGPRSARGKRLTASVRRWTEESRETAGRLLRRLQAGNDPSTVEAHLTFLMTTDDGPVRWWFQGGGRRLEGETRDFSDIPADVRSAPVHVWTPARATRISSVTSPTRNAKKMLKALPFLLEETTLDDSDNLHFAYQPRPDGLVAVAVTAKAAMDRWLKRFRDAGLAPASFCPASLGLACDPPRTASIAFFGDRCCARTGEWDAYACSWTMDNPSPELLSSAAALTAAGTPLQRLLVQAAPAGFAASAWEKALGLTVDLRPGLALRPVAPMNLLQGAFAPSAAWRKALSPWKPVAALFALWLAGTFVVNAWDVARLSSAQRRIQSDSLTLFRGLFPDATTILDPSLQLNQNLEALRAQAGGLRTNDFLSLMAAISPAIGAVPGVTVKRIDYEEGALTTTVGVPDFRSLETLKAALDKAVGAEWLGADGRGGAVEARFRVREAAQ